MYKGGNKSETGLEEWLNRLQEVLENTDTDAIDFVEDFKLNLYSTENICFSHQREN